MWIYPALVTLTVLWALSLYRPTPSQGDYPSSGQDILKALFIVGAIAVLQGVWGLYLVLVGFGYISW